MSRRGWLGVCLCVVGVVAQAVAPELPEVTIALRAISAIGGFFGACVAGEG